jgi:lipoprotein-anchoring transpeptidase ErfK/SrfK
MRLGVATALVALAGAWCGPATAAPTVRPAQALVTLLASHAVRSAPHASTIPSTSIPARGRLTGDRTVLPLLGRSAGGWLHVRLPGRPNGATGWISAQATSISVTSWHVVVEVAKRRVVVYRAGRVVKTFRAVVGKPSTPTPAGTFFVEEALRLEPGHVGAPFALALSARSEVLQEFAGGPGQIAVHGRGNVGGVLGTAASHGCIRLGDEAMFWLVGRVGAGAPVTVTN